MSNKTGYKISKQTDSKIPENSYKRIATKAVKTVAFGRFFLDFIKT
ncbi:MAG: hypothetical protein SO170_08345 [Butyribacter sp.]|nr:hypothetical protein [Butyribacter sp.]